MYKKKYGIYKIIFISFGIVIIFDLNGFIHNNESFLFCLIITICILYGLYEIQFFSLLLKGLFIMKTKLVLCLKKIMCFFKKIFNGKEKKKVVEATTKTIKKKTSIVKKPLSMKKTRKTDLKK